MGSAKVGKTSIITQFLYNTFSTKYKRTIEEMHQGNFSIAGVSLTLDILDTAGSYEVSKNYATYLTFLLMAQVAQGFLEFVVVVFIINGYKITYSH